MNEFGLTDIYGQEAMELLELKNHQLFFERGEPIYGLPFGNTKSKKKKKTSTKKTPTRSKGYAMPSSAPRPTGKIKTGGFVRPTRSKLSDHPEHLTSGSSTVKRVPYNGSGYNDDIIAATHGMTPQQIVSFAKQNNINPQQLAYIVQHQQENNGTAKRIYQTDYNDKGNPTRGRGSWQYNYNASPMAQAAKMMGHKSSQEMADNINGDKMYGDTGFVNADDLELTRGNQYYFNAEQQKKLEKKHSKGWVGLRDKTIGKLGDMAPTLVKTAAIGGLAAGFGGAALGALGDAGTIPTAAVGADGGLTGVGIPAAVAGVETPAMGAAATLGAGVTGTGLGSIGASIAPSAIIGGGLTGIVSDAAGYGGIADAIGSATAPLSSAAGSAGMAATRLGEAEAAAGLGFHGAGTQGLVNGVGSLGTDLVSTATNLSDVAKLHAAEKAAGIPSYNDVARNMAENGGIYKAISDGVSDVTGNVSDVISKAGDATDALSKVAEQGSWMNDFMSKYGGLLGGALDMAGNIYGANQAADGYERAARIQAEAAAEAQRQAQEYQEKRANQAAGYLSPYAAKFANSSTLNEFNNYGKSGYGGQLMKEMDELTDKGLDLNYKADPAYLWRQKQQEEAVNRQLAARGMYGSRAGMDTLADANMNLSGQEADKQYGRAVDTYNREYGDLSNRYNLGYQDITNRVNTGLSASQGLANIYGGLGSTVGGQMLNAGMQSANNSAMYNAQASQTMGNMWSGLGGQINQGIQDYQMQPYIQNIMSQMAKPQQPSNVW